MNTTYACLSIATACPALTSETERTPCLIHFYHLPQIQAWMFATEYTPHSKEIQVDNYLA